MIVRIAADGDCGVEKQWPVDLYRLRYSLSCWSVASDQ